MAGRASDGPVPAAAPQKARIPAALVLALAGVMVAIGVVAIVTGGEPPAARDPDEAASTPEVLVDTSTPERAAESFLDAWRKREHEAALAISVGDAHEAVLARQRADAEQGEPGAELKQQVWDRIAADRLTLRLEESENLPGQRLALRGTAEGEFVGRPYARRIAFVLRPLGERWQVEDMTLGDVLSEGAPTFDTPLPDVREDPSMFEVRGANVP